MKNEEMTCSKRRNVLILAFALVVVTLGFGMVIPLIPLYVEALGAGGSELGLLVATSALLELLCAPVWGSASDRTGRKPILMVGVAGYALSLLLFGLSSRLWMLFASRALSGLLSSATAVTAMLYVGDSTAEEDRGGGIGILGAAMGLGLILGPGLGGLLGASSLALPFFIGAGLAVGALLLILAFVPESLPSCERRSGGSGLSGVRVAEVWRALTSPIGALFGMLFLVSFGLTNFKAVFGFYSARRLGYGPERVGVILVVVGVVSTLGKATLIGPLTKRWGEVLIAKLSLIASSAGFLILLLAARYATVLLAVGFFILSKTFLRTALLSLASRRATVGQGVVMGLGNSFINLGRIVGPVWVGYIFDVNTSPPYLSGAAIMFLGFVASLVWIRTEGGARRSEAMTAR